MTFDLILLGLVLTFAIWGAFQGAARQVAQAVAGVGAWFAARPAGSLLGPTAASQLHTPLVVGTVAAIFVTFVVVFVLVRWGLTVVLRRLLRGKSSESPGLDRFAGFLIGGAKVLALTWVTICALSFVEENVTVQGKKFGFVPRDSIAFNLARQFNLFELSQFSGVKDVIKVAKLQSDPKKLAKLKENADYQGLIKDPRFLSLLDTSALKKAIGAGDTRGLLQNNQLLQLLQDPQAMKRIEAISQLE